MKQNRFSDKVNKKNTEELLEICSTRGAYARAFVLAALWELERRDALTDNLRPRLEELENKKQEEKAKAEYKSHLIPPDLPRSIKIVAICMYLTFIFEIVGALFLERYTYFGTGGILLPGSFMTLIVGFFIHKGQKWARIVFFILYGFSTLFFVMFFDMMDAIGYIQHALLTMALVFILIKQSRKWYAIQR